MVQHKLNLSSIHENFQVIVHNFKEVTREHNPWKRKFNFGQSNGKWLNLFTSSNYYQDLLKWYIHSRKIFNFNQHIKNQKKMIKRQSERECGSVRGKRSDQISSFNFHDLILQLTIIMLHKNKNTIEVRVERNLKKSHSPNKEWLTTGRGK